MITAAEASAIILHHTPRMPFEAVPLMQAIGSVTANDITATITHPHGEDFRAGDLLLGAGCEITPAAGGLLASAGTRAINAYRRPTVAVISSGDELVMLDGFDHVLRGERIVSSNSYTLPSLVREAGGVPYDFGIAADNEASIRQRIDAARGCDLIITSAGISTSEHDHTRSAMAALSIDLKFWQVQIHPGAPLAFGTLDGTPWIGLSRDPVSAMVTFELFVRPAIRKMRGYDAVFPISFPVRIVEPVTTHAPLTHFLRAVVMADQSGIPSARLTGTQSSAALSSMVTANALLVVPHDRQHAPAGEILRAIPLGESILRGQEFPV